MLVKPGSLCYNLVRRSGRSADRLAHYNGVVGVVGSNPTAPTEVFFNKGSWATLALAGSARVVPPPRQKGVIIDPFCVWSTGLEFAKWAVT